MGPQVNMVGTELAVWLVEVDLELMIHRVLHPVYSMLGMELQASGRLGKLC